ncbi:energy-coupling factor ABC transporter ATP-binding protein [Wukongibacter sp. M2B1]|uniref:energy-coupling factor ABC transporter ATP-binding protein n=1 Tax=Wukongibacter sp. M2B1 TaxID=3088895 RepID=UPI003D7A2D58
MLYVEARNVTYRYPKKEDAIRGISLDIFKEDVTAIIGHNGGGKTTLGKLLSGILKPVKGDIYICGEDTRELSLGQIGKKIGYLFQNPNRQIFTSKVEDELLFVSKFMGGSLTEAYKKMNRILDFFDLETKKDELTYNLSYGEKQRLALSAVLMNEPEFLILDEPTTGLDELRKDKLSEYLYELKKDKVGIIIISHDMEFIRLHASRKIEIARGEIINDTR